jgi:hypothetical protein
MPTNGAMSSDFHGRDRDERSWDEEDILDHILLIQKSKKAHRIPS